MITLGSCDGFSNFSEPIFLETALQVKVDGRSLPSIYSLVPTVLLAIIALRSLEIFALHRMFIMAGVRGLFWDIIDFAELSTFYYHS